MKKKFLDKSFIVRDIFTFGRLIFFISFSIYIILFFFNRWTIEMGGVSKNQMQYTNYPNRCEKVVDIHRGAGSNFRGSGMEYLAAFAIKDREFSFPTQTLIENPECFGYSIKAGINARPHGGGSASQANVRIVFTDDLSPDPRKGRKIATVIIEYHD